MTKEEINHISYSQLIAIEQCPYQYFLTKVAGIQTVENPFAQAGNLAHELLARWAKGELLIKDLPVHWIQRFPEEVTAEFPHFLEAKGYKGKLFDSILTYFENFDGFPDYEVVGAEQEFSSMIAGERLVGIIDLLLRDKETGRLMIVDFKSCSVSSFRKNRDGMYRQLLLYSKFCSDQYGCPPSRLRFELIKENTFDERPYDPEDFIAARIWAESVIDKMKNMDIIDWLTVVPDFFRCQNLCSARMECCCGKPEYYRKDEKHGTKRTLTVV